MSGKMEERLSPWWLRSVILVLLAGFSVLILVADLAYRDAPPIPEKILTTGGKTLLTARQILAGQKVFEKYGLMENGTIWGHGAYLGPDFSAAYLHSLGLEAANTLSQQLYGLNFTSLPPAQRAIVTGKVRVLLKQNRYNPKTGFLVFTDPEADSYIKQVSQWARYLSSPAANRGLEPKYINNPAEIKDLTAFFAWTAWASVANRPGETKTYTNNFPYDPLVGNYPPTNAVMWSAFSLITLLVGLAVVLFAFGRFDYLGWRGERPHIHPQMLPGQATQSQKATVKFFLVVSLLFLLQVLVGAATEHFRAQPGSFYGLPLNHLLPSNILRTWHLQLAIFWIATAFVGGGLLLGSALGEYEPRGQVGGINLLFWALSAVVGGSLLGELLGIDQLLGKFWFWFGHQGWEYLDLGRGWQILLALGLLFWAVLVYRSILPALLDPERKEISWLFMLSALTIPVFYLPAFFFGRTTEFSIVDNWRFWIIHLWVEGFFELFVTTMVAVLFYRLDMVTSKTAVRVIYLDAILFMGSGIIGTGHHWYWTGQTDVNLSLSAVFSAMEVVPLTLLTLDAWDFIRLTRGRCDICGKPINIPHKWTFYFLMAVGFWNFVGAGVFGFLINLPIVSYFEVGTMLTPNHGHAALMGVFGMEAVSLMVLAFRQASTDLQWATIEKYIRLSFWGLNIGLALMIACTLFPGGVLQLRDVLAHGYWHARGLTYLNQGFARTIEWIRMPGDLVFIALGVIPLVIAAIKTYANQWAGASAPKPSLQ